MSGQRSIEDVVGRWLAEEASMRAPERLLLATVTRVDRTRQRGGWAVFTRPARSSMWRWAFAGLVAVVGVGLAIAALGMRPTTQVGSPTRTPVITLPIPTPTAIPTIDAGRVAQVQVGGLTKRPSETYLLDGTYAIKWTVQDQFADAQCSLYVAARIGDDFQTDVALIPVSAAPGTTTASNAGETVTFPHGTYGLAIQSEGGPAATPGPSGKPSDAYPVCSIWSLQLDAR